MRPLSDFTAARVALARAGHSLATEEVLRFQLAHALARDAVHQALDAASLRLECEAQHWPALVVRSAAGDRATYLRRPDLGRRLAEASGEALVASPTRLDVAVIIADGLSALAVHRHAVPLLAHLLPHLETAGWSRAPLVLVEQGRVAIGDEIGQQLNAAFALVLIGERPGLSSPDSLGAYLTWDPRPGRTDAERNCLSNIRPEGLGYEAAASRLFSLMTAARQRQLTGVALKEDRPLLPPAPGAAQLP